MTTLVATEFDWVYVETKAWPEMPVKLNIHVILGYKYLYDREDVTRFILGENLPERLDQPRLACVCVAWPVGIRPDPTLEKALTKEVKRQDELDAIPIIIFVHPSGKEIWSSIPKELLDIRYATT